MSWLKAKDWASGVEYSSLFHSGLRAISLRPRVRCTRANSVAGSSSLEKSSGRSSVAYLSSRLLRRSTTRKNSRGSSTSAESSPPPTRAGKAVRPRPSSMFVRSTKEISELWSSGGDFFEIEECQKCFEEDVNYLMPSGLNTAADPFSSSPGSRSFYVNLGDIDTSLIPPKEESFLSLSNTPDVHLHRPPPRRERPVSMHAIPFPSQRSSLHHRSRDTKRERLDHAWMLEESSPEMKAQESGDDEDVVDSISLDSDVADWRQFHVDWLQNEPTVQLTPVN
ncbi:hypothetical protein HYDPIDRAFT_176329 [Hydnomerulius pinastri MD-312]|uniref:Uncharacterized protein n=1 Tax=Hydnomerulius pinastri MD-312 TaxID=994086 RepID=A0A0C9WDC9_9AGAM|nr:hypothetical protein HYDPIDRAFT_176329 [Hydnomerulius pinastri MD-312]